MNYSVIVDVTLRKGIADPEGSTIERALPALGFTGVTNVHAGKSFRFDVEADDETAALDKATAAGPTTPLKSGHRRRVGADRSELDVANRCRRLSWLEL